MEMVTVSDISFQLVTSFSFLILTDYAFNVSVINSGKAVAQPV
jgi:hypothetical protein